MHQASHPARVGALNARHALRGPAGRAAAPPSESRFPCARTKRVNVAGMPGRPKHPRTWHSATNRQLWRLNVLGRIQVVDEAVVISAAEAEAELKAELEKMGEQHFPKTRAARRVGNVSGNG
jgi:hypothetical protein